MKRTLSLVLDDNNTIALNLIEETEANELDKFILSHFEDSEDIRKYYKKQIDSFLSEHQSYVDTIQQASSKKFRGWIRLLEVQELRPNEVSIEQVRILYPKHIAAIPSMIQSQDTLKEYQAQYNIKANKMGLKKLTKDSRIVHCFHSTRFKDKRNKDMITEWVNRGKGTSTYYDRIRILVKAYEIVRKKYHLPTIDNLYKYIQLEKKEKKTKPVKKVSTVSTIEEEPAEEILIDGVKYTLDDLPALDDDVVRNSQYHRDGLGPRK